MSIEEEINSQGEEQNQSFNDEPVFRNRRQRRFVLKKQGSLQALKNLSLSQWMSVVSTNQKEGLKLKNQQLDEAEKRKSAELEKRMENTKNTWREIGYSPSEIEKLEEAYAILNLKDKDNWQEEKAQARKLMKEAEQSRKSRQKTS
jgi:hypothetical protein